jgi:hypothetical protein
MELSKVLLAARKWSNKVSTAIVATPGRRAINGGCNGRRQCVGTYWTQHPDACAHICIYAHVTTRYYAMGRILARTRACPLLILGFRHDGEKVASRYRGWRAPRFVLQRFAHMLALLHLRTMHPAGMRENVRPDGNNVATLRCTCRCYSPLLLPKRCDRGSGCKIQWSESAAVAHRYTMNEMKRQKDWETEREREREGERERERERERNGGAGCLASRVTREILALVPTFAIARPSTPLGWCCLTRVT